MAIRQWLEQLFLAVDQLANVLVTPFSGSAWADETLSSRAYRAYRDGKFFGFTMKPIDLLFFWQPIRPGLLGHCHQAYVKELERAGLPPEFRQGPGPQ
jgi:hypothetical protein